MSVDGEEGFPGNLSVEVIYHLSNDNALEISYQAMTDKTTIINLTQHSFFNLAGNAKPTPTICNHILTINADHYTPMDNVSVPTGQIAPVAGTPMDFRTPHVVGERIDDKFEQLVFGKGYDHCYVLNKKRQVSFLLPLKLQNPRADVPWKYIRQNRGFSCIRATGWADLRASMVRLIRNGVLFAWKRNISPIVLINLISPQWYCIPGRFIHKMYL